LLKQGYDSEASYLDHVVRQDAALHRYKLPLIKLDEKAANGGENARNGLRILTASGHTPLEAVTTVVHATSARRLSETVRYEAGKIDLQPVIHVAPTAYKFDPDSAKDRDESAKELLRLADWPNQGKLGKQEDLPKDLVDFARERHGDAPKPIDPWQSNLLRALPAGLRLRVINYAANHGRK
jgi:hypothetical protein